jgi:hypothetical protein
MANCSAVISDQTTGTEFYSTVQLAGGMFYANSESYMIFDDISINGT